MELTVTEHVLRRVREGPFARLSPPTPQLLAPERIEELSIIASRNTIDGFMAQDQGDFDRASLHFSVVFQSLFPEFDSERMLKAAEAYVSALLTQSKLKDDNPSRENRLHDERWEMVRSQLLEMCRLLDMPSSYAQETMDLFRYHAAQDDSYVKHLLESHRLLMKRVSGSERNYRELAGLYLSAISLHDQHSQDGIVRGRELMQIYYNILFYAKSGLLKD